MLSLNDYQILKEIQSLHSEISHHQGIIDAQNKRIIKIKELKSENLENKEKNDAAILAINSRISSLELMLTKQDSTLKHKQSQIMTMDNEKQLKFLEDEIVMLKLDQSNIEEALLIAYGEFEELQKNNEDFLTFFQNIDESILEISNDASEISLKSLTQVNIIEERIIGLKTEIPIQLSDKIDRLISKKVTPFLSPMKNQSCSLCGMSVPSQTYAQIIQFVKVENCGGCARIMLPEITWS